MGALILLMAVGGITATVIALMFRSWMLVAVGFVLTFPFMLYLLFSTLLPLVAAALIAQVGAAIALQRHHLAMAWVLFLPTPGIITYASLLLMGATMRMYGIGS